MELGVAVDHLVDQPTGGNQLLAVMAARRERSLINRWRIHAIADVRLRKLGQISSVNRIQRQTDALAMGSSATRQPLAERTR